MANKQKSKKTTKKSKKAVSKANITKRATPKKKVKKSARTSVKPAAKKAVSEPLAAKKTSLKKASVKQAPKHRIRGKADRVGELSFENTGLGARTGGQSGDTQGLSGVAETNSESVKELLEEGQSFEAEVLEGVENVPDADEGGVRTRQVPENDVPEEYLDKD